MQMPMSNHSHQHGHGGECAHAHGTHDQAFAVGNDALRTRRLLFAFGLTAITLVVEAIGGWMSGSLALFADAGHMLVDAGALLFAWLGASYARRPADARRSFGYARLEVLVGYSNALVQFVLVAWIASEAIMRMFTPAPILSGMMLAVALIGLVVNAIVLGVLGAHDHEDVNTAAARLHVIGDLFGSLGAVGAALVIRYFDWLWADAAISILVSLLILNSAWRLLRRCAHILLEGVPEGAEVDMVAAALESEIDSVSDVHHVHVWQLAGGSRIATLHARLTTNSSTEAAIVAMQRVLRAKFGIDHATVQIEGVDCVQVDCGKFADTKMREPLS